MADPQDLRLRLWVNRTLRQDGTTAAQISRVGVAMGRPEPSRTCAPGT
ncbi:hypothetical protein ACIRPP_19890 [Streptomyces sp. NPDC101219]